jgi:hypothetical protein
MPAADVQDPPPKRRVPGHLSDRTIDIILNLVFAGWWFKAVRQIAEELQRSDVASFFERYSQGRRWIWTEPLALPALDE